MGPPRVIAPVWRSPEGQANALALQANFAPAFGAIAEIDALGHRLLTRMARDVPIDSVNALVAAALSRRVVTQFLGIRHLFEASVVEQAKLGVRAQFETLLAGRYLLFGGSRNVDFNTRSDPRRRETRARYFHVAAERRDIYWRQVLLDQAWRFGSRPANRRRLKREMTMAIARLNRAFPLQQAAFGPLRCLASKKSDRRYHDSRPWFSFGFRGKTKVNSIGALARRLGLGWEYSILYSALSGLTHPAGTSHDLRVAGNALEVFHPYMADAFPFLCNWSCLWQLGLLMWTARVYHPASVQDVQSTYRTAGLTINALRPTVPSAFV